MVWALPGSLAATTGILSFPRGTLDVSVPPVPSVHSHGHLSPGGVAPFGLHRIIGCQRLPRAFRRVATSFIGPWRLGIHRLRFFDYVSRHRR